MKELYKVSKYTKKIVSIFMIIVQMRMAGLISNVINMKGVKSYREIVKGFSSFLQSEEVDDVQQIYEYYNYAMWNGYFSENHKLKYTFDRDIYLDNAGMSIMSGSAVCLNYADMLTLIFEEMGYKASTIMCYVNPENVEVGPIRTDEDIERTIDSSGYEFFNNIFFNSISKLSGNHAITCVESGGEIYFFDPTNLIYLNKTGVNDVSIINGAGNFDLRYFSSLFFDNPNVLKIITYKNKEDLNEEILEKQEISVNIDELENFYNNQKENISDVAANNKLNFSFFEIGLCAAVASIILVFIRNFPDKIVRKNDDKDIDIIFPKLKEYFKEKNIITEFEALKNYELLERELGIKSNVFKDLIDKAFKTISVLVNNRNFYPTMLCICLNQLGYNAFIANAKKVNHCHAKKAIKLIYFRDKENNSYFYDYEIEELLYADSNGVLCSLDGKYKYFCIEDELSIVELEKMQEQDIKTKMNNENVILSKEEIKLVRKNKTLNY